MHVPVHRAVQELGLARLLGQVLGNDEVSQPRRSVSAQHRRKDHGPVAEEGVVSVPRIGGIGQVQVPRRQGRHVLWGAGAAVIRDLLVLPVLGELVRLKVRAQVLFLNVDHPARQEKQRKRSHHRNLGKGHKNSNGPAREVRRGSE